MDREKIIKELHDARRYLEDKEWSDRGASPHIDAINDVLALLKEQEGLLGIQQTANSITFVSTGTAQQGEERGEEDEPVYTVKPDDEACNRFELNLTKEEHNDQG